MTVRISKFDLELKVGDAEVAAKLEAKLGTNLLMSMRISQFDAKLKDGVAKVAAKLGPDQQMSVRMSDFEPTLKVVAAKVAGRLGTDQRQLDFLRSSLRGSSRFPVFKTHGAPKPWWVYIGLLTLSAHYNCFHGPGQLVLRF